ncbi:hypothetical protein PS876_01344 [Pseudomonas fluorescens]|jgi:hypothetical protein|uniref:hypothetical protein n=1 Tax=Pseudomonas fluorescens TaxID=294 RepID=UPI00124176B4|nr:hypothetical protein [Pseudomonas fluorescens]VVO72068.1 hypothetical protein PS876_01344 [Pseudomonas fluorescens]
MNVFKNKHSANAPGPFISVNCDLQASISNRVNFNTQNIEFQQDANSNRIAFIARSYENALMNTRKGMMFIFPSDIKSGSYKPTDADFPFGTFQYYEIGVNDNFSTSYDYSPKSGTVDIEVISNDSEALCYVINFEYVGGGDETEELHITGKAEFNVFMRAF